MKRVGGSAFRYPAPRVRVEELRSPGCLFAENRDLQLRVEELEERNEADKAQRAAQVWDVEERLRSEVLAHESCRRELEQARLEQATVERSAKEMNRSAEGWSRASDRSRRRNQELLEQVRETERLRQHEVEALTRKTEAANARAEELGRRLAEALEREERLTEELVLEQRLRRNAELQVASLSNHSDHLDQTLKKALAEKDADISVVRNAHRAQLEARFLKKNFGKRGSVPEIRMEQ